MAAEDSDDDAAGDLVVRLPDEDEADDIAVLDLVTGIEVADDVAVLDLAGTEVAVEDWMSDTPSEADDTDSLLLGFSRRVAISRDFPNLRASCCVMIFFFRCRDASAACKQIITVN